MPLLERSRQWLGLPEPAGRSPRSARQGSFWSRHVWPPTIFGIVIVVLLASVLIGFVGGYVYTQSSAGKVELQDPAGPVRPENANPVPTAAPTAGPTTTKLEVLSVEALGKKVEPSVWRVTTMDEAGKPVEVSAMVAGSYRRRDLPADLVRGGQGRHQESRARDHPPQRGQPDRCHALDLAGGP